MLFFTSITPLHINNLNNILKYQSLNYELKRRYVLVRVVYVYNECGHIEKLA